MAGRARGDLAPLFIGLAVVTALGLGFFLSAMNVRYRDVRYMIPVFLQVLPLLSGVMYAVESIPVKWQWILALNPMTAVISGWRWAVVDATGARLGPGRRSSVAVAVVLFVVGLARASARPSRASRTRSDGRSRSRPRGSRSGTGSASSRPRTERCASRSPTPAKPLTGKEHKPRDTRRSGRCDDVSFEVEEGEVLGVIGRNGAGKSTLLKVLTRITTPTSGRVEIRGRVGSLLEVGTGFHPELTGRENIYLNGAILGMKRREIQAKLPEIVEFSGVERFLDTPVKRYSSGMYVRLAFSVAAHLEPEILLVDEVLAVGDAEFQRRCLGRMEDFGATGRTVLFVSHNMQAVAQLCDRAILMEGGRIAQDGRSEDVVAHYLQTSSGSGSSREWPDLESAPGDDLARLLSVRIVDRDGADGRLRGRPRAGRDRARGSACSRAARPSFRRSSRQRRRANRVQRDGRRPAVARAVASRRVRRDGLDSRELPQRGAHDRSTPPSARSDSPKLHHHVSVHEAVSFHVQDPGEGDSARGTFTGQWRGVVRPLLDWESERTA